MQGNSVTSDDTGDDNWDSCSLKNIDGWSSTSKSTVRTSGGYGGIKVQSSTAVIDGPFCSPEQVRIDFMYDGYGAYTEFSEYSQF